MRKILSVFLVPVFALLFSLNAKSESLTLGWAAWDPANAVSYTHLTLPTTVFV